MLAKLKTFLSYMQVAKEYRSIPQQFLDIVLHRIIINFSARDYYRFEFYKPGKSWAEKSRYVGADGSRYWPFENNPPKFGTALTNKYIQKHLLLGFGLPTPRLLTSLGKGFEIQEEQQFHAFLDEIDQDIVVKSMSSSRGSSVRVVRKRDGTLYSGNTPCTREWLWQQLSEHMERGYIIEKRVRGTGVLARLNPVCLNTFRVITIKTKDGRWHCAAVSAKVGAAGAFCDNSALGYTMINLNSRGRPYCAYDVSRREMITHDRITGLNLHELELDGYHDVVALALSASQKFSFLGTVGWDIAYTDEGAMIIEGNISWACHNVQRGRPGIITDELAQGLDRHYWLNRWNKSGQYPGYGGRGLLRRALR